MIGALTIAGLVNLAMLLVAARAFGSSPAGDGVDGLEAAHAGLGQMAGGAVALAFAATLLASGLSSAAVGTYSGQVVMEGFVDVRLSPTIRRTVTMLPALALLAIGTARRRRLSAARSCSPSASPSRSTPCSGWPATRASWVPSGSGGA